MPAQSINIETSINALSAVVTKKVEQQVVSDALMASNGDWEAALTNLTDKLPETSRQKVAFANTLTTWSNDNVPVVQTIAGRPDLLNLRDVVLNFSAEKPTALVDPRVVPENITGATDDEKKRNFAVTLQHELFALEPTAVLQRMVQEAEIPLLTVLAHSVGSCVLSFDTSR
jgi:hypothetical protein